MPTSYEEIKGNLYANLLRNRDVSLLSPEALSVFEEELDDWCGTPPRIPNPWNPSLFVNNISLSIADKLEARNLVTLPPAGPQKIIGVGTIVRVVLSVLTSSTLSDGTHDGQGNHDGP
jgi:hypothetical protein|tara:strand:- start:2842 stop:3195 length:354 start_codon:yes stop_codon:yes gene_type:complete